MGYTHGLVVIESSIYPIIWKYIFISKNVLFGKYTVSKGFFFKVGKKIRTFFFCSLQLACNDSSSPRMWLFPFIKTFYVHE